MNTLYQKLNEFGTLVYTTSRTKNMDMADYFTVLLPAHPVIKNTDQTRPNIRFNDGCPWAVKREVATLWRRVFT